VTSHISKGVRVTQQIPDETAIFVNALRAGAVRHARGLDHRAVVPHVVHHAHEPVVEHRERDAEHGIEGGDRGPCQPLGLGGAAGGHFFSSA
jgi:hypothetical protein